MVVDSELVRQVERKLESLPIKGFETALHVLVVIATLKDRHFGAKHLAGVERDSTARAVQINELKNLFIPRDEHRIAALAPITMRSDRGVSKGGKKM